MPQDRERNIDGTMSRPTRPESHQNNELPTSKGYSSMENVPKCNFEAELFVVSKLTLTEIEDEEYNLAKTTEENITFINSYGVKEDETNTGVQNDPFKTFRWCKQVTLILTWLSIVSMASEYRVRDKSVGHHLFGVVVVIDKKKKQTSAEIYTVTEMRN